MAINDIPLIVILYEKKNFQGRKRFLVQDEPSLSIRSFDNKASSLLVLKGPTYDNHLANNNEPKVSLYLNAGHGGDALTLPVGSYAHIPGDRSSVKIVDVPYVPPPPPPPPPPANPVGLVVELYADKHFAGRHITLIESSLHLGSEFGFNELTSSVRVWEGPNFAGEAVTLYKLHSHDGQHLVLGPGEYPDLADLTPNLNNHVSSVRIGP